MRLLPFSISLSLSTNSSTVFCLLRVRPEGPRRNGDMMSRDLEEPWVEEVTTTKEVHLKESTGTWRMEDSTLVFTLIFGMRGWPTSFPTVERSTPSASSETTSCLRNLAIFLFLALWPASVPSTLPSTSAFLTASYLIFFSLPLPTGVATPIASTTPFLIGTSKEEPTMRSHLDQVSGKSLA